MSAHASTQAITTDASVSFRRLLSSLAAIGAALLIPNGMLTGRGPAHDRHVFAYIGWLMHRGFVPYRDVWDHKGPLLYAINWLGWVLTPDSTSGIGILQVIAYAIAFLLIGRIVLALAEPWALWLVAVFSVTFLAHFSDGSNLTETWGILPIAVVHAIAYWSSVRPWRHWYAAGLGISFAACFWIRPNLCAEPLIAVLVVLHYVRVRNGWRKGLLALGVVAACGLAVTAALVIPLVAAGAWRDMLEAYFSYNKWYSAYATTAQRITASFGLLKLLRTEGLFLFGVLGWALLFRARVPQAYRVFLLLALAAELASAALSGRAYYHYLAPLLPVCAVLTAVALNALPVRRSKVAWAVIAIILVLQIRKYVMFEPTAFARIPTNEAVASFIDRATTPSETILPVGDLDADDIALRSRRLPASKYIFQLGLVHIANKAAAAQQKEFVSEVESHPPAVIFSAGGEVGDLCRNSARYEQEAARDGYQYGEIRTLLAPVLKQYRQVSVAPDACVYVRQSSTP